jgi:hypothetical protein
MHFGDDIPAVTPAVVKPSADIAKETTMAQTMAPMLAQTMPPAQTMTPMMAQTMAQMMAQPMANAARAGKRF